MKALIVGLMLLNLVLLALGACYAVFGPGAFVTTIGLFMIATAGFSIGLNLATLRALE